MTNSNSRWVWDYRWALPFESSRSLLEKFSLLNGLTWSDLRRLLAQGKLSLDVGASVGLHVDNKVEASHNVNLEHARALCARQITKSVYRSSVSRALDRIDPMYDFKAWFLAPAHSGWSLKRMPSYLCIREYLQYCPLCLEAGYHSIWHQCMLMESCPIHHTPLLTTCKWCNGLSCYNNIDWPVLKGQRACVCGRYIYGDGASARVGGWLNTSENAGWVKEIAEGFADWHQWYLQYCASDWIHQDIRWNGMSVLRPDGLGDDLFAQGIMEATCPSQHAVLKCSVTWWPFSFAFVDYSPELSTRAFFIVRESSNVTPYSSIDKALKLPTLKTIYGAIRRHIRRRYVPTSRCVITKLIMGSAIGRNSDCLDELSNDVEARAWIAWKNHWEGKSIRIGIVRRPTDHLIHRIGAILRAMHRVPDKHAEKERLCAILLWASFHNTLYSFRNRESPMEERMLQLDAAKIERMSGIAVIHNRATNKELMVWRSAVRPT